MNGKLTSPRKMGIDQSLSPSDHTVHYATLLPCFENQSLAKIVLYELFYVLYSGVKSGQAH